MKNIPEIRIKGFFGGWKESLLEDNFDNSIKTNTWARIFLSDTKGEVLNIHYGDILIKFGSILDLSNVNVPHIYNSKISDYNNFLQNGDVVFADTAEDETAGKAIEIANIQNKKLVSGLHTIACHPKREFGNGFWGYYLNSPAFHSKIISLLQGIKVLSLSKSKLAKVEVNIPKEISEQQSIGTFFQNLDNLITEQKNKLENLQKVKKSMLCKMFPKKGQKVPDIRFKGFEGNWKEKKLGEICILNKGKQINKQTLSDKGKYYVLNGGMTPSGYTNKYNASENTISISEGGNSCGYVFYNKKRFWSGGHNYTINQILLNKAYLFEYLKSNENEIMQLRIGSGLPNIQKNSLLEFKIMYPAKLSEQNFIGNFFMNLDEQISLYQQKLEKLKNLKQSLLSKMFV